ncbi:MAG: acetate--CoA ligase, partial [Bacteroidota bacterium]
MSYPFQLRSAADYEQAYQSSVQNPELFWSQIAEHFHWHKKWDAVLTWNFEEPKIEWFKGGQLNITENCLDRHLPAKANDTALIFEPNDPKRATQIITYQALFDRVNQLAQVLKNNGVKKGDRVAIYMGMIPELAIATLACARIGAIHSVIFGGFSAQSIADRLQDAQVSFVITCDGAYRGAKEIPLKSVIDDALVQCPFVEKVLVYMHTHTPISMLKDRDLWWEDEVAKV